MPTTANTCACYTSWVHEQHAALTRMLRCPARFAAANQNPIKVVANWTLGQPLAAKPGEQYSYSDDAYALLSHIVERVRGAGRGGITRERACACGSCMAALPCWRAGGGWCEHEQPSPILVTLTGHILPTPRAMPPAPTANHRLQVSNQSLGAYLQASIFAPANLTGTVFVPGTGGGLVENLVNNPGYISLFNASAGACLTSPARKRAWLLSCSHVQQDRCCPCPVLHRPVCCPTLSASHPGLPTCSPCRRHAAVRQPERGRLHHRQQRLPGL